MFCQINSEVFSLFFDLQMTDEWQQIDFGDADIALLGVTKITDVSISSITKSFAFLTVWRSRYGIALLFFILFLGFFLIKKLSQKLRKYFYTFALFDSSMCCQFFNVRSFRVKSKPSNALNLHKYRNIVAYLLEKKQSHTWIFLIVLFGKMGNFIESSSSSRSS